MARSTYYYHISLQPKEDRYRKVRQRVAAIFEKNKGRYGYRRVYLQIRNEGIHVNHKKVQKLMCQMNLKAAVSKAKYKSYKGEVGKIAPNIIERDFKTDLPNRKWTTDVTEFKINEQKAYLSPILDMFNGEIVSYTISDHPDLKMVMDMVRDAVDKTGDTSGVVLHSDQGWHYQHKQYQKELLLNGITQSMSRKGNCFDNAIMESFFGTMKSELLYLQKFKCMEDFKKALKGYIEYYNNSRIKLRLKGMSPVQYRTHTINSN